MNRYEYVPGSFVEHAASDARFEERLRRLADARKRNTEYRKTRQAKKPEVKGDA